MTEHEASRTLPVPESSPAPESSAAEAPATPPIDPDAVLVGVLDTLGAAHHRPFSRAKAAEIRGRP